MCEENFFYQTLFADVKTFAENLRQKQPYALFAYTQLNSTASRAQLTHSLDRVPHFSHTTRETLIDVHISNVRYR